MKITCAYNVVLGPTVRVTMLSTASVAQVVSLPPQLEVAANITAL